MPGLTVRQLQREGLGPLDLEVAAGETLALFGASGSGKTLLLRAIADLDPNQGEVTLGEHSRDALPAHRWRTLLAYVPPESHWWAETVGPHADQWDSGMLQALGFGQEVLDWEIRRLSSGERQRLALLRALARQPAGLLLDEPTANLDQDNTLKIEALVRDYQQCHRAPVIWVSHDEAQRARVAQRTGRMHGGRLQ
jgi:ABC-type iron transport system FetAB ATPase subunit